MILCRRPVGRVGDARLVPCRRHPAKGGLRTRQDREQPSLAAVSRGRWRTAVGHSHSATSTLRANGCLVSRRAAVGIIACKLLNGCGFGITMGFGVKHLKTLSVGGGVE